MAKAAAYGGPVDYLGCRIEEGDTIVYPVRRGSVMSLKMMKIIAITTVSTVDGPVYKLHGTNDHSRHIIIHNLRQVVVVA
jgi:hypothetical protein